MDANPLVPVSRQAFAVQYTSLILILLTFVIGAFSGRAAPPPLSRDGRQATPVDVPETIGIYKLANSDGGSAIAESLGPVLQLLANHDITATLSLPLDSTSSPHSWELISQIGEVLDSHRVAPDSLNIALIEGPNFEPYLRFNKPTRRVE
jgi:hypothetical protein